MWHQCTWSICIKFTLRLSYASFAVCVCFVVKSKRIRCEHWPLLLSRCYVLYLSLLLSYHISSIVLFNQMIKRFCVRTNERQSMDVGWQLQQNNGWNATNFDHNIVQLSCPEMIVIAEISEKLSHFLKKAPCDLAWQMSTGIIARMLFSLSWFFHWKKNRP